MISFIDNYVQMHLQEMWRVTVDAGEAAFRAMFNDTLDTSWMSSLWVSLGTVEAVQVRSAWHPVITTESDNIIAVELDHEGVETGFLANAHFSSIDQWSMQVSSTVGVYIWSRNKDAVRVLHAWTMAAMLSGAEWFLRVGTDGIFYEGATDIGPERRLLPDGVNTFMRKQAWRFVGTAHLSRPGGARELVPKWVTVADSRVIVGSRLDAESGEEVPFADTLPGGARPLR